MHADDEVLLRQHLLQPPALEQDAAPAWTAGICAVLNHATWMRIAGAGDVPVLAQRGTRPGSCFADLFFGAVLKRVIQCWDAKKDDQNRPRIAWDGCRDLCVRAQVTSVLLFDVIWADDLVEAIDCATASVAPQVLGVSAGSLAEHGMKLSHGPKKTAATVLLFGPGAKQVSAKLFRAPAQVRVLQENSPPVSRYKHVGVQQAFDGSLRAEVRQRLAEAWGSFRSARCKVFKNPKVTFQAKRRFLQSLILPKLLYGAGSWPPLKLGERRSLQGALLSLHRQILGRGRLANQHLFASSVCALADLPPLEIMLHLERIRYLRQMVLAGPDGFGTLIKLAFHASLPPQPQTEWDAWEAFFRTTCGKFKGL